MVKRLSLGERLDSAAAEGLWGELKSSNDEDLVLDASKVENVGGLCLELLMCARQVWVAADRTIRVENPSPAFTENLARFGLNPDNLAAGGAQ